MYFLFVCVRAGFFQGVQRSVTGVATILGPLWGGSLGHRMVIILSVMTGLEAFLGVRMLLENMALMIPILCTNIAIMNIIRHAKPIAKIGRTGFHFTFTKN